MYNLYSLYSKSQLIIESYSPVSKQEFWKV